MNVIDEYSSGYYQGWSEVSGSSHCYTPGDVKDALAPIMARIRDYDRIRVQLEERGGQVKDLLKLKKLLLDNIEFPGRRHDMGNIKLGDRDALRRAVLTLGRGGASIGIRTTPQGFPVYYLCRTSRGYWGERTMILEDLCLSQGYPMDDVRYVKFTSTSGRERGYLRISPYRFLARSSLSEEVADETNVDKLLEKIGRQFFQAAWDDDQRIAFAVADALGMPQFKNAVELLYFCLSSDLSELRNDMTEDMQCFLSGYKPEVDAFMQTLSSYDGMGITQLQADAPKLYKRLQKQFSRFIKTEILWGEGGYKVPLYKIIFANFSRLQRIGEMVQQNDDIEEAAKILEYEASEVISLLINRNSDSTEAEEVRPNVA